MLGHDIKYAVRSLLRTPTNTIVAAISLGLAVGITTTALSVVNALFAKEVAIPHPEELVTFSKIEPDRRDDRIPLLLSQFELIRARNRVFSHLFAWRDALLRNIEINGARYLGAVNEVSGDYFSAIGVQPFLGRAFGPDEVATIGAGTSARVAVLDYRCWEQRFARDPAVLGKTIVVDGVRLTIIGVMPREFVGLNIVNAPEAIVPIAFESGRIPAGAGPGTASPNYYASARLQPGTSLEAADAFLQSIWPAILEETIPPAYQGPQRTRFLATKIALESLRTGSAGSGRGLRPQLRGPLTKLLGLSALVVLVAFVNLAGLILLRAMARRHELGLRASLGATRFELLRVAAVEATLVSGAGAVIGVIAAFWTAPLLLVSLLKTQSVRPLILDAAPDLRVLAIAIGLAIVIGLVSALIPAWYVVGRDPVSTLRQNVRTVKGGVTLFHKVVICVQLALAFVITAGALLFGRSLYNLHAVQPGFRIAGMLTMDLLPQIKQQTIPNRTAYYKELGEALTAVPGVDAASFVLIPPRAAASPMAVSGNHGTISAEGIVDLVGPGFFRTMGITVLSGREFDWRDDERAPRVAIIDDAAAAQMFPEQDPIGQVVDAPAFPFTAGARIVGVVPSASLWNIQSERPRAVFFAMMQMPAINAVAIELHTTGDAAPAAHAANRVIEAKGYQYSFRTQSLTDRLKYVLVDERMLSRLSIFFAGLTILLACAGLYGLVSYAVLRRRAEIGIRVAVGAQRHDILRMILRDVAWLLVWSLAIGVPLALISLRVAADTLFGLTPHDPVLLTLAAITIATLTIVAAYVPGRRASRIEPVNALRIE